MKKSVLPLLAVMVLFLLLTHPALSFQGASRGLLLWYQTVLPTLLPLMICSNVIVSLDGIRLLTAPMRPVLKGLFGLSDSGCYVLVSGLLCGYPMGAKTCSEFVEEKRISLPEGRFLLSVSNHPSPMFLLGYVASMADPSLPMARILLALYLPVLPIALISGKIYRFRGYPASAPIHRTVSSFDQSMMSSFEVMIKIGGYLMLFSILAELIGQIPFLSASSRAVLLGIVEITTGIQALSRVLTGLNQGMALCFVIAFGGLCGLFQTRSVLGHKGLSAGHYTAWKMLHGALSLGIFYILSSL